ncbi:integral membrane protein YrbE3A [Mycobacteroides abscessus subsp. massiliense]|uniref:Integral membrane protein YrbE3A n=2 Tax=Mycobacteroides abscessus TaxID=36809 RepID=A0A0U0ZPD7_9MYCO|nr:integral membrane protein YrbE3A [Mycobacteroides abscessus]SKL83307.1 integral membrane protein YrbE3A [Mycobacteroides abscessus subsp. massiliense]SLE03931.1 integral membrane protein YrbE3A [Mycobacteroides abscessus subsp. abscessus]SKN76485.1 integral membrane protein YrbE3A [Mycobacteroides abscessus subsp. massiliense]SKP74893.1 integral membrane protein YrbE3A [Mycobacteroides abscessus subsp. massiliense]
MGLVTRVCRPGTNLTAGSVQKSGGAGSFLAKRLTLLFRPCNLTWIKLLLIGMASLVSAYKALLPTGLLHSRGSTCEVGDDVMVAGSTVKQEDREPKRALGGFAAMTLDTFSTMVRGPVLWREAFLQVFSIARVAALPTVMLAIPFAVLVIFEVMLLEIPHFPPDTVLVLAAAGATAVCVDVSSYAIREEINTLRATGVDPIQALVVPRVLAGAVAAVLLSFITVAATGVFFFSVFGQHTPLSQYIDNLMLLAQPLNVVFGVVEAALLGLVGGLWACYKGISASDSASTARGIAREHAVCGGA